MKCSLVPVAVFVLVAGFSALSVAVAQRAAPTPETVLIEADPDDFDPGLPVGADFPPIRALYNGQEVDSIDPFIGEKGLVFVANRSVDWCPYCRIQAAELQDHAQEFADAGIGIVVITYDTPQLQQNFIDAGDITYPFISDIGAETMISLGILNTDYSPGERAYGIPYPGAFVVNPDKKIVGKIFVDNFRIRVDGAGVLEYARALLD